jgi:heat shock transcription factor
VRFVFGASDDRRASQVPSAFLEKLYDILEEPTHYDYISWSKSGETIIIKQVAEFSSLVLPKYYKHNNFQSFVRQVPDDD